MPTQLPVPLAVDIKACINQKMRGRKDRTRAVQRGRSGCAPGLGDRLALRSGSQPGVGTAGSEKAFHGDPPRYRGRETDGHAFGRGKHSGFPLENAERNNESAHSIRAGSALYR